jgi:hypothetical protein
MTPEASYESVKAYEIAPSVYYAYYMDFNSNVFMHPYILTPTYPLLSIYSSDSLGNAFKSSAKSSFSAYNSKVLA